MSCVMMSSHGTTPVVETTEKPLRPHSGKQTSVDKGLRESWEPSIHLDGRPVDRFVISSSKPTRSHPFTKMDKDSHPHLLEDVDPEWVNLDGFAVLGGAPVRNSTAGPVRASQSVAKNQPSVQRATREDRTAHSSGVPSARMQRRAPQSSSGPRQPERPLAGAPLLERRRQHHTKPQSDQRNRNTPKLTSESVHVVSLQAQKAVGQSAPANRQVPIKTTTPEPPEYEARDISVRVLSPKSVLITWVDPAVEMGKVVPGASRSYTVRYREKGESARWEYKDSTQRRMMIDSLSADGMYEFSVRISQGENYGKWSVSVFQRTPESAPSGPPENFEVKPLGGKGTAVKATWDSPEEPNGRIREYILSYAPAMKPFGMKSLTYRGSTTTATIDGLTPGDRYIFKIRATNRRGQGPQSKAYTVAMPGSSSATSSFSRAKDTRRTSHTSSKQDTNHDEFNQKSTEAPTKPPQSRPAARVRPLSQTRSYHSIFSSVRGSVKNTGKTGLSRGRAQDTEDEEEEEEKIPTTPSPVEETTMEVVPETKEPDNEVSPEDESEDEVEYEEKPLTTVTPSLKVSFSSPTKPAINYANPPRRRPIKIRVHKKPVSKAATSLTSIPSTSSSSSSSSHIQESAASRMDYVASTYPESKNAYDTPDLTTNKPSISDVKETNPQQTELLPTSAVESKSHSSTTSHNSNRNPSTSQSRSQQLLSTDKSGSSHSTSHRASHSSATSHNTHNSHRSPEQSTNEDIQNKNTNTEVTKAETRTTEEDRGEDEGRDVSTNKNPVVSHTKISPSFAERFPWLASRYPGQFSSATRMSSSRQDGRTPWTGISSSVGASTPIITGTSTRVSGATASSSASTSSTSHESSSGHKDPRKPVYTGTSDNSNSNRNKDYVDDRRTEISGKYDQVTDSTVVQKNPAISSANAHKNAEDNESVDTSETPSRTRSATSSGVTPSHRRPSLGVKGRGRSLLLTNRPFGGLRIAVRPKQAQNSRMGSSASNSSSLLTDSSSSSNLSLPLLTSDHDAGTGTTVKKIGGGSSPATSSSSSSSPSSFSPSTRDGLGVRSQYPKLRGKVTNGGAVKPANGNGKNGRPNLTATNDKESSSRHGTSKAVGQRFITGPDGSKWVVDLEQGILMNQDGKVLQDSQGKPKRVVLGEDGRTIFDHMGSPLVNQEGMALFGHSRDSRPVVNPKEKVLTVGGKPVLGLDRPRLRTTIPTTTKAPTTTPEPTTPELTTEKYTTAVPYPSCPSGTFSKTDEHGYPVVDAEGILDCYPEEESSGMEMDHMVTVTMVPDALALEQDKLFLQTTLLPPTTTTITTTTPTPTTTTEIPAREQHIRPFNQGPSSEFDLSGKKRFTAPYVNYIRKDPGAPCSLTEALEYLQVDILEDLIKNDSLAVSQNQPPKNKPYNLTVVAMEGCHSFIILDWGQPLKDDMVSGYMVHSASYDDVINNRWSSRSSSGTHLPVENLKPNSRYYFKVQAKNVFGLGPVSDTLTYVTESDDPLLIERPPGGEPIWIPFTFKYNPVHSSCKGSQYVKRTWYRKFVGVVLCNSLRYKIFMGDGLREPFYSIGDTFGQGEDHCQFVDSYRDGRTGPAYLSNNLPSAQGFYRAYRQEPVTFGVIGRRTPHAFVGWYECGVPIPGKW
ncbi:Fibronectin type III domain-containing protein 1 Activator of G-protein signaling 8 Precursor [Channa argus]|uniref:Fibronectin type III domain-containing protein 1 Activator of G-protein signaling 8 n=1 Tax=Channa argus TaxID=215402 RepID=A0A6G1QK33_CHAAH|nr:Fibronectin type III domain-containing protein 1 Activator of G-protein signaling 8 Precursor [Channa argus]